MQRKDGDQLKNDICLRRVPRGPAGNTGVFPGNKFKDQSGERETNPAEASKSREEEAEVISLPLTGRPRVATAFCCCHFHSHGSRFVFFLKFSPSGSRPAPTSGCVRETSPRPRAASTVSPARPSGREKNIHALMVPGSRSVFYEELSKRRKQ